MPYSSPKLADEPASQIVAGNVTSAYQPISPTYLTYLTWHAGQGFGSNTFDFAIDFTDEGSTTDRSPIRITSTSTRTVMAAGPTASPTRVITPPTPAEDWRAGTARTWRP